MKKEIITVLTAGVLLLSLAGCNKSNDAKNTVKEDTTSITTQKAEEQKNTNSDKVKASEHIQNAPITAVNAIQVSPKHVYYQDGNLYMEAFVYNGFNHLVYDIKDIQIALSNKNGLIAQAMFPSLQNVQIAPNSYIAWTFIFGKDLLKQQNADLSYLATDCFLKNSY